MSQRSVQAANLRAAGWSVDFIMQKFGWSRANTHNQIWRGRNLESVNATRRATYRAASAKQAAANQRRKQAREEVRARIVRLIDRGFSWQQAAQMCGVSTRTVARACQSRCTTMPDRNIAVDGAFSNTAKQP